MASGGHQSSAAIALLSGGLDSSVASWLVSKTMPVRLGLTINYGQQAFVKELEAAKAVANWLKCPHQVIELPWLAALLPSGMVSTSAKQDHTVDAVWVPNRNGVLLNIAAAFAEGAGASHVIFGANLDEAGGFPDNSMAYVEATNHSLSFSTQNNVTVLAPVAGMTKADMLNTVANEENFPLDALWSCYLNGEEPCGKCLSCQHRQRAESLVKA